MSELQVFLILILPEILICSIFVYFLIRTVVHIHRARKKHKALLVTLRMTGRHYETRDEYYRRHEWP